MYRKKAEGTAAGPCSSTACEVYPADPSSPCEGSEKAKHRANWLRGLAVGCGSDPVEKEAHTGQTAAENGGAKGLGFPSLKNRADGSEKYRNWERRLYSQ